jgi:hypothetical protein
MGDKLTLRERHLLLWVCKQKRLHHEQKGKYDALDESAVKGMFERLFFGTYKCMAMIEEQSRYAWLYNYRYTPKQLINSSRSCQRAFPGTTMQSPP